MREQFRAGLMAESTGKPVLYVSGEESARQIKMRAKRLSIESDDLFLVTETNLETIFRHAEQVQPLAVIVDSVRRLQEEHDNLNIGYDVLAEDFGDMVEKGIIDAAKVTRAAVENAASIAAMILTTEALITDIPMPPPPPAPASPY